MQLHHSLLALEGIGAAVARSTPGAGGSSSHHPILGLIMLTGWIPRGKGRSPAAVEPAAAVDETALRSLTTKARSALAQARAADPAAWWEHPIFGLLRRDRALRFAAIHTHHHLKIVRDILAGG